MSNEPQSVDIGIIGIDFDTFNKFWQDGYPALSDAPGELIELNRQTDPFTSRFKQLQMGQPRLSLRSSGNSFYLELEQRALGELEVVMTMEAGASARWMNYIRKEAFPSDRVLKINIEFSELDPRFKFYYSTQAGKALSLVWAGAVNYTYSGSETDKLVLTQYYDSQKKMVINYYAAAPTNPYLQSVELQPSVFAGIVLRCDLKSPGTANITGSNKRASNAPAFEASGSYFCTTYGLYFPENLFGKPPVDFQWIASLMVPYGMAEIDDSSLVRMPGFVAFSYRSISGTAMVEAQPDISSVSLTVSPLMAVLGAGYEKEPLEVSDFNRAALEFVGAQHGAIEKGLDAFYYVPPPSQTPLVIYETSSKTLQAAAQLQTVRERAVFDVIKVTVGGVSALSTFVTLFARQTHYIKCLIVNGQLTLQLWYYDVDQAKDVRVPVGETEWSTLYGGGSVSSAGVFTHGSSAPSTVSVIAGRDLGSSRLLYWAVTVIPIPLYSAAQAVKFFND
ncbi:hypothetical protein [Pseudomonas promysalinigenes]|uniref:Uncharacterized protein n=1 Tax=Pseudomonas promysalinigenes TaxID=485898 RepID=A0ABY6AT75_9PSED|nr:hypothetical protein [Pseudomonas promysalinigenes]UXH41396.1 hypothetical protein N5C08_07640 [Pseudomonas promysalinigenes]